MTYKLALIALIAFALFSCSKDDSGDPANENCGQAGNNGGGSGGGGAGNNFTMPSTEGSYWVYEWYRVPFEGEETILPRVDSVYVSGDSLIGGELFTVYKGSFFNSDYLRISRDSSGYFIDPEGNIHFSYTNFSDTIDSGIHGNGWNWYLKMYDYQTIDVPAGPFITLEARNSVYLTSGEPVNVCGDQTVGLGYFYADGIGLVRAQIAFSATIQACDHYEEARLVRYNIAP